MQGKAEQQLSTSSSMTLSRTDYAPPIADHSDAPDSDVSQEERSLDFLGETSSSFEKLSLKRKPNSRMASVKDEEDMEDMVEEPSVPELDEKDKKNYGIIQKAIEDGFIENLKLDQCKIYLRKHGLRLTGKKDVLIRRIKEHLEVVDGGGEKKYPPSSFVVNCQGDACTGDVVLFEQNVYEMFSIASRSGNGPPSGTRVIAGRIVKESYGAAKQQHTFTIEVLWSRGEKPLPPLHPLLIKGRNLYRLRTMRRRWEDEGERQRILAEKHARGCVARSRRDVRVQQKEMRNMLKSKWDRESKVSRNPLPISSINMENRFQKQEEQKQDISNPLPISSINMENRFQKQEEQKQDISNQNQCFIKRPNAPSLTSNIPFDNNRLHVQRQPLTSMNSNVCNPLGVTEAHGQQYIKQNYSTSSGQPSFSSNTSELFSVLPRGFSYQEGINNENVKRSSYQGGHIGGGSVQQHFYPGNPNINPNPHALDRVPRDSGYENRNVCRNYYARGRCHYGQNCKYLH